MFMSAAWRRRKRFLQQNEGQHSPSGSAAEEARKESSAQEECYSDSGHEEILHRSSHERSHGAAQRSVVSPRQREADGRGEHGSVHSTRTLTSLSDSEDLGEETTQKSKKKRTRRANPDGAAVPKVRKPRKKREKKKPSDSDDDRPVKTVTHKAKATKDQEEIDGRSEVVRSDAVQNAAKGMHVWM
jgi:hypothetical protein